MRRRRARVVAIVVVAIRCCACGEDVDLGGTGDASVTADAGSDVLPNEVCEPCAAVAQCRVGATCAALAVSDASSANTYCATPCAPDGSCSTGGTCRSTTSVEGKAMHVCAPLTETCPAAVPPSSPDGGTLEKCGVLVGPTLSASCRDCHYECQRNGCYAGWWCNTQTRECVRPPKSCP